MKKILAATAVGVLAFGGAAIGCGPDESSTSAPSEKKSDTPAKKKTSERADLKSFKLDDRSQSGMTDIWVKWTIKNSSSEKSTYTWDWEAVAPNGERIANGTELSTSVQPGQTAKGEDFTTLKTADVKLNITSFDRTKGY